MEAAPLILALLAACKGSQPAPSSGSGSPTPTSIDAGAQTRAIKCVPAGARVKLALRDETVEACWEGDCPHPPPWGDRATEVRMDNGALSACGNGCRRVQNGIATQIAGADPSKVRVSPKLDVVIVGKTPWRVDFDHEITPTLAHESIEGVFVAGELVLFAYENERSQLTDINGSPMGLELPFEASGAVQLDAELFVITHAASSSFSVHDKRGKLVWRYDGLTGMPIIDVMRVHDGRAALLLNVARGWFVATVDADAKHAPQIVELAYVPSC